MTMGYHGQVSRSRRKAGDRLGDVKRQLREMDDELDQIELPEGLVPERPPSTETVQPRPRKKKRRR